MSVSKATALPVISNIRGSIFLDGIPGNAIQVGQFRDDSFYQSYRTENPGADHTTQGHADWYCSFAEMALIEKSRDGREPKFQVELWVELSYLLPINHPRHEVRTESKIIFGRTEIVYPKEIWISRLRSANALENVLVEIPLPSTPPSPWDEVWEPLISARRAIEEGGETAWKACVTEVRTALEKWRKIEPEDQGPGSKSQPGNVQDRTKKQRLDNLRWHLHHCTHFWVHNPAAECTRADALLMLATLSALLAQRNP